MTKTLLPWPRVIMHGDMDAYFAAVETLDDARLAGVPLVIGGQGRRSVVCTANYEARRFGISSAMPMTRALRLCPDAVVVAPRHERYREVSAMIMETFREFTPLVEPLSLDEAYLDLSECTEGFEGPHKLGRALKNAVLQRTGGLTISVGISTSKFVAKVASDFRKPDGLTVVNAMAVPDFIRPMPVSRLWGAGPRTVSRLQGLGLNTIGEVADAPAGMLARLGQQGVFLQSLARGEDRRAVVAHREAKSVGWERTVEDDLQTKAAIFPLLRTAAREVQHRLRIKGKTALGVRLKLKTRHFETMTRQRTLSHSTRDESELLRSAMSLLREMHLEVRGGGHGAYGEETTCFLCRGHLDVRIGHDAQTSDKTLCGLCRGHLAQPIRLVGLTAFDLHEDGQLEQLRLFDHQEPLAPPPWQQQGSGPSEA